jgi:hypothetical protein
MDIIAYLIENLIISLSEIVELNACEFLGWCGGIYYLR